MSLLTADPPAAPAAAAAEPSAPPPTAPSADPVSPDWVGTLPDDLKGEKGWERFKDVGSLARSYRELEKKIGQNGGGLKIPGADAKPEEIAAYRTALGVPADAKGYEFDVKEFEGSAIDAPRLDRWKSVFHKLGIPKDQAQGLVAAFLEDEQTLKTQAHQQWVAEHETLRKEWGEPLWNRKLTDASRAIAKFDPDGGFRKWLDASGLGDHPMMIRQLSAMGAQFREDGFISGDLHTQQSEGDIRARIASLRDEILKHPEGSAERQRLTEERQNLYRMLPGGERKVLEVR